LSRHWLLAVSLLLFMLVLAISFASRESFSDRLALFLRDEGIGGGVAAYGRIGSPPTLLAVGKAAPDRTMRTDDRFRLASLAKPVTAAAVLRLVDEKRISLDTPVPEAGPGITVRHLLQHSGGWDRSIAGDPIGNPATVTDIGVSPPYDCMDIAKRLPPAQFRPGTRYAYSNIGYCWLGHIIEQRTGQSYAQYVEREVLASRGAKLLYDGQPTVLHSGTWPQTAYPALGPGGGWVGTAGDYWRFAAGPLDAHVTERPPYAQPDKDYYGLGWRVWPDGTLSHFGAIEGAFTMVVRKDDRVAVLLFNGRPANDEQAFRRLRALLASEGI